MDGQIILWRPPSVAVAYRYTNHDLHLVSCIWFCNGRASWQGNQSSTPWHGHCRQEGTTIHASFNARYGQEAGRPRPLHSLVMFQVGANSWRGRDYAGRRIAMKELSTFT